MSGEQSVDPPAPAGLPARIRRALARDSHLSLARRIQKGLQFAAQLVRARGELKTCNRVGRNARVAGRMRVENHGSIVIGDQVNINSCWVPTELVTGPEGQIRIGDEVLINYGTVIAAGKSVAIGSGSMIGPYCIISDVDIPESAADPGPVAAKSIQIGKDVWIAGRVTVRPGVSIGDGAVVVAGSIVELDVPARVMAGGIPARLLPKFAGTSAPVHGAPTAPVAQGVAAGRAAVPMSDDAPTPAALNEGAQSIHSAGAQGVAVTPAVAAPRPTGVVISDFSLDELVHELTVTDPSPPLEAVLAPYGQPALGLAGLPRAGARDFAIVWTRPEAAVPAFERLTKGESVDERQLATDVDVFCASVEKIAKSYRHVLMVTWTQPAYLRGLGVFDYRQGGAMSALSAMNLRMVKSMEHCANVVVLNAARWQSAVGPSSYNPRAWYMGRMAMARPLIAEAARDFRAALAALDGRQRKLLVLDSSALLWGPEPAGATASASSLAQAHADFMRSLQLLRCKGVMLALLGKFRDSALAESIDNRLGDDLRSGDFAAFGSAEGDVAANLDALAARLGIAPNAVVYVDGHEAVRGRIRAVLPDVYVPDWPADHLLYPSALQSMRCFDVAAAFADRVAAAQ